MPHSDDNHMKMARTCLRWFEVVWGFGSRAAGGPQPAAPVREGRALHLRGWHGPMGAKLAGIAGGSGILPHHLAEERYQQVVRFFFVAL